MSMISSNCDDLRNAADELQNVIDNAHNYTWQRVIGILHYAQQGLRDAANIIWGLSCKLADTVDQSEEVERLEDENARLRSCLSDDVENARQIMGENARMRELIQKAWKWEKNGCYECPLERDCKADSVYDGDCGMAVEIEKEMRELRIEVK